MPYPLIVNLKGKRCVVVGAGKVAEHRIASLRMQDAAVLLVAPEATLELAKFAELGVLTWIRAMYSTAHLDGAFLVIAATNLREVNRAVAQDAQAKNILVTCADEPADGNYITPSVIERGELLLALSTNGKSPTLASVLRERLEQQFGPEWASWTTMFGNLRSDIQNIPSEAGRKSIARQLLEDDVIRQLLDGQPNEAEAAARRCILSHSESAMPARP